MDANIELKEVPKLELAYVSCIGKQNLESAIARLLKWGTSKNLLENGCTKILRIFHDSFKKTESDKVRMSICLLLNGPTDMEDGIGLTTIEAGRYIVGKFEIGLAEYEAAWMQMIFWMKEHGQKKADADPFELFHNDYRKHPDKKSVVDLYIPIA